MAETTTRFCDATNFAGLSLSQYGRFSSDQEAPLLPFLVEHTILAYVTCGTGSIKLGTGMHSIAPGTLFVLFPGTCANFTGMGAQPCSAMWMELSGSAAVDILQQAGLTPSRPTLTLPESDSKTAALFAALTDTQCDHSALRAAGLAMETLDQLMQDTPYPSQLKIANLQRYYVDKSIRYIQCKYPQDISVEDVAEYCGLNRSYLGKLFRDATGMTTQEYLIRHRMQVACTYLERGAASIATIARSVGYPNQLHFSRAFHKVFGIPPREWQKRNRKS